MKKESMQKIIMGICYGILFFFMFTIVFRSFTRFVLVKGFGMENNVFVKAVFFDQPQLMEEEIKKLEIDWEERYPFPPEGAEDEPTFLAEMEQINVKFSSLKTMVISLTDKVSEYSTDFLMGRKYLVAGMYQAEQMINWNIGGYKEYNGVVALKDGRLTEYLPKRDVTEHAESVINLKEFCDESDCDFLYVQSPYAVCKEENSEVSGILDFSNQNADDLLEQLQGAGVECLDMRQCLHEDGLSHADAFFRTDHHWKPETGLWAAGYIAGYLNKEHGFPIDCYMLEKDKFTYDVHSSWWLGSRGRKLTDAVVEPEDFTMLYPKYKTQLYYKIPTLDIEETGDFSVTYDMDCIGTTEGYSPANTYTVYNHGENAVTILQNLQNEGKGKRILMIKDSFMDVVIPFLACTDGISEIDVLDVRCFNGSTRAFIKEKKPDIVIVSYNPNLLREIDWEGNESAFDFR